MRLLRPTVCLLVLVLPALAAARSPGAEEAYGKARTGYYAFRANEAHQKLRHHWLATAKPFDEVARRHPRSARAPDALFTAGMLYEDLSLISRLPEDLDAAITRFSTLVKDHARHRLADDAALRLGTMLLERREAPDQAREWVERALEAQPRGDQAPALRALLKRLPAPKTPTVAAAPKPQPRAAAPAATAGAKKAEEKTPAVATAPAEPPPTARPSTSHRIPRADDPHPERQARRVGTLARAQAAAVAEATSAPEPSSEAHTDDALAEAFRRVGPQTLRQVAEAATPPEPAPAPRPSISPDTAGEQEGGIVAAVSRFAREDAPRLFGDEKEAPAAPSAEAQQEAARKLAVATGPDAELSLAEQLGLKVRRVVIDAGHGGHDPGAIGKLGTKEKDIALAISKRLKVHLEKQGLEVLLTRDDDRYLKLEERTRFANQKEGDLFISIHCNASVNRKSHGVETYTLNVSSDRYAIRLAARENASSEKSISDLQFILADLATKANTGDSTRLAQHVQGNIVSHLRGKYSNVRDLGHKEALFYVLLGAKMPSILVETAFISHPEEEKRLRTPEFQEDLAVAIARGVERFLGDRARLAAVD